jgi:Methyltransferase domain
LLGCAIKIFKEGLMFRISQFSFLFCCAFSSLFAVSQQDLPSPYDTAEILPFFDQGWYSNKNELEWVIKKYKVKTIIEVGSWLGASTRHMATCIPEDGIVYAVDHWKGSIEHQAGQWASIPGLDLEKLYEYFLSNTIQAGLAHKIAPVRKESLQAAAELNVLADLVFIDASHDEESVYKDLVAWYPHIKNNGIFCGDDWLMSGVKRAVISFAKENGFHVMGKGNFWRLEKWIQPSSNKKRHE